MNVEENNFSIDLKIIDYLKMNSNKMHSREEILHALSPYFDENKIEISLAELEIKSFLQENCQIYTTCRGGTVFYKHISEQHNNLQK
jgi:hypothetical protein